MNEATIIGADMAKNVFQLHGAATDETVLFAEAMGDLSWASQRTERLCHGNDLAGC